MRANLDSLLSLIMLLLTASVGCERHGQRDRLIRTASDLQNFALADLLRSSVIGGGCGDLTCLVQSCVEMEICAPSVDASDLRDGWGGEYRVDRSEDAGQLVVESMGWARLGTPGVAGVRGGRWADPPMDTGVAFDIDVSVRVLDCGADAAGYECKIEVARNNSPRRRFGMRLMVLGFGRQTTTAAIEKCGRWQTSWWMESGTQVEVARLERGEPCETLEQVCAISLLSGKSVDIDYRDNVDCLAMALDGADE